jgi:glycosyltransferase involved in cell wall biosynthesis
MAARAPARVRFTGRVGDIELARLLSHCRALVHPQEEDFGLTAVEAQAAGRPVIALAAGGAMDTVRPALTVRADLSLHDHADPQATGVHFERQRVDSLMRAVRAFEANEARFESKRIRDHAERFSPERFLDGLEIEIERTLSAGAR